MSNETIAAPANSRHPKGLYFIFWGEFAERSCYYGMRAILPLYMTQLFLINEADANSYYSWFKTAAYLLPLLGGFIADRFLGRYWSIVAFSIPYVIGQLFMATANQDFLFLSLGLLAFGSGMIKPNISSLLGMTYDQQRPGDVSLRGQAFYLFYFAINIGAFISMLALPLLRDYIQKHYSMKLAYQIAFSIPAVLMVGALFVFALGKKYYAKEVPQETVKLTWEEKIAQWKSLIPLLSVFLLIVLFWIPYEHNDTQWVFFAKKYMNLNTPWLAAIGGPEAVSADAFQWINSLGVLILIPFFAWFWPKVDPTGRRISPIQKMSWGFVFTACGPMIMALCAYLAQGGALVSSL
jgi:dipeptide/tripeptide permease